jgi:altronate hydrolase
MWSTYNIVCNWRGSVVGSAISPVIKICANPKTYQNLQDDMDINAGKIIDSKATLEEISDEIYNQVITTTNGSLTKSEALGHREFVLGYKYFNYDKQH